MFEPVTVVRMGLFRWRLYANYKYRGRFIADFLTRAGAECAAKRLNRYLLDRPRIEAEEARYEEACLVFPNSIAQPPYPAPGK